MLISINYDAKQASAFKPGVSFFRLFLIFFAFHRTFSAKHLVERKIITTFAPAFEEGSNEWTILTFSQMSKLFGIHSFGRLKIFDLPHAQPNEQALWHSLNRKVGRVIDRAGLEIRYTLSGYRGFESLIFRKIKQGAVMVPCFCIYTLT